ncbi:thioredoxin family protein [Caulobacter segnis]
MKERQARAGRLPGPPGARRARRWRPTLDELAEEYADEMEIVKVDIEANPKLAERFAVRGIPLLMIVKDGAETARTFGTISRSRLDAFVDANDGNAMMAAIAFHGDPAVKAQAVERLRRYRGR